MSDQDHEVGGLGRRILIVEDEDRISQFLAKGLMTPSVDVVVAEDGSVGAFLATTERFDLVILDLGLPGISGLDILQLVRRTRPAMPVILLTASDERESREIALAAGASEYITKPFVFEELRARVLHYLSLPT